MLVPHSPGNAQSSGTKMADSESGSLVSYLSFIVTIISLSSGITACDTRMTTYGQTSQIITIAAPLIVTTDHKLVNSYKFKTNTK